MNQRNLKWWQTFVCCLSLMLTTQLSYAQQKSPDNYVNKQKVDVSQWRQYAGNPNLTYKQITHKADSLFLASNKVDTAEDGEAMRYARWKLFWHSRLDATTGKLYSFTKAAAIKQRANSKNIYWRDGHCEDVGNPWSFIGPMGINQPQLGRVTDVAVNPNNKDEIYIANSWGGIWKTTNAGQNWVNLGDNDPQLSGLGVSCFTVQFSSNPGTTPNKIYASFGYFEESITEHSAQTFGLYISNDDGQTFSSFGLLNAVSFNWDEEKKINDMKISPVDPNYVFLTTKFKVIRIYAGNQMKILIDFRNTNSNPFDQFRGFHNITFADPTPWPNQRIAPMFVNGLGAIGQDEYKTTAMLFRTDNCLALAPAFTDITGNLNTSSFNASDNTVLNNDFSFTGQNRTPEDHWLGFDPWGAYTGVNNGLWEVQNGTAQVSINWNTSILVQGSCLETSVPGYFGSTSATANFTSTVDIPVNTRLVVKLKDVKGITTWQTQGHSCGQVVTEITIYDSDLDPTVASYHNSSSNLTNYTIPSVNVNVGNGNHYNRLVFEVQFKPGYTGVDKIKVDNVNYTQPFIYHVVTGSSPAAPNTIYSIASKITTNDNLTNWVQKSTDYGNTWTNLGSITGISNWGNIYMDMEVSKVDPNVIYYNSTHLGKFNAYTNVTFSNSHAYNYQYWANPTIPTHADVRSLLLTSNGNGTEDIFTGHDGGLSVWRASSQQWECPTLNNNNREVFDCAQAFGISSDIHSGDVYAAAFDNGINGGNVQDYDNWTSVDNGSDGWYVKHVKRHELMGLYIYNWGGGEIQNLALDGANTSLPGLPFGPYHNQFGFVSYGLFNGTQPNSRWATGWYTRPKTTYEGEYYADASVFRLKINPSATPSLTRADLEWENLSAKNQTQWDQITTLPTANNRGDVSCIAAHPYNKDIVIGFAADGPWWSPNNCFFYTLDGGNNWHVPPTIQNGADVEFTQYFAQAASDMCIDPQIPHNASNNNNLRAWASMTGYGSIGVNRVYQGSFDATNNSWSWIDFSTGLPDGPVTSVLYDEQSKTLFAATDIGVYSRTVEHFDHWQQQLVNAAPSWECYSKNMPNSIITDLDINYCTGQLYANCYGRGVWSADLPSAWHTFSPNDPGNTEYIKAANGTTIWNSYDYKEKTIIVESGATLKIENCTIAMARGKHIVVEPGAVLVVDNSILTNECNRMWGGIVVEGDPNMHQAGVRVSTETTAHQGLVIIKNGSSIENAYIGVYVGGAYYDGDDFPQYVGGKDGGYLSAKNSSFINCRRSISFAEYNHTQGSIIDGCTFEANHVLNNEVYTNYDEEDGSGDVVPVRYGAKDFIAIWACNGVSIKNSTFGTVFNTGVAENHPDYFFPRIDLRGTGIISDDAGYTVENCTFDHLTRGVFAFATNSLGTSKHITGNTFINNWRAIGTYQTNNVNVKGNTIHVGPNVVTDNNDRFATLGNGHSIPSYSSLGTAEDDNKAFTLDPYGIYISHTSEFIVMDNEISEFNSTPPPTIGASNWGKFGIIINESNTGTPTTPPIQHGSPEDMPSNQYAYRIYRNNLNDLDWGIVANQNCRGVQIKCNNLENVDAYGIAVTSYLTHATPMSAGYISDQGYCFTNTSPAGNTFNHGCPNPENNIFISTINNPGYSNGLNFAYSHYNKVNYPLHEPICVTPGGFIQVMDCGVNCSGGNCCPDPPTIIFPPDESEKMIANSLQNVQDNRNAINVGLGDLQQQLNKGNAIYLYNAIDNPSISSGELSEMLLDAGPYLSDDLMIKAIKRTPAMHLDDIKKVLLANASLKPIVWDALAVNVPDLALDKDIIAAQNQQSTRKSTEGAMMDLGFENGIYTMNLISIYGRNNEWNKIADLYNNEHRYLTAYKYYVKAKNYDAAKEAVNKIDDDKYKALALLQIQRIESGKQYDSFSKDELVIINEAAQQPNTFAGEAARLLLSKVNGSLPLEVMPMIPATDGNDDNRGKTLAQKANGNMISIYPNPANDHVTISTKNGEWGAGVIVSVYDVTGRRVVRTMPEPNSKSLQLNTSTWISGIYFVNIKMQDGRIVNEKFVINK